MMTLSKIKREEEKWIIFPLNATRDHTNHTCARVNKIQMKNLQSRQLVVDKKLLFYPSK